MILSGALTVETADIIDAARVDRAPIGPLTQRYPGMDVADKDAEKLFGGRRVKKYGSDLCGRALQKLLILNAANDINDLRMPPGNRLEALTGDRKGQHSIRVNDQHRICFTWTPAGPTDVEIVDYH